MANKHKAARELEEVLRKQKRGQKPKPRVGKWEPKET